MWPSAGYLTGRPSDTVLQSMRLSAGYLNGRPPDTVLQSMRPSAGYLNGRPPDTVVNISSWTVPARIQSSYFFLDPPYFFLSPQPLFVFSPFLIFFRPFGPYFFLDPFCLGGLKQNKRPLIFFSALYFFLDPHGVAPPPDFMCWIFYCIAYFKA